MIYKKKIDSIDPRLGRHINWDSRSADFAFDTTGIVLKDTTHQRLVPIFDQGQLGSCTGNAGIGAINTVPFALNHKIYSPDEAGAILLYSEAEKIDGGVGYPPEDTGSSGLSIAKALLKAGLISAYKHCFTLNDTLKALTQYPVISGINWYNDMFTPDADGRVHPTGNLAGGHEIEAYRIDCENGRIWFNNSWGTSWGVNGDFYLTWADFYQLLSEQGDVIILIPPTKNKMQENITALQTELNTNGANLVVDGVLGPITKEAVKNFIGTIATQNDVEPILVQSVATCEGGLNPFETHLNADAQSNPTGQDTTDRGLYQFNSYWFKEVTDAQAFDITQSTIAFCNVVKSGGLKNWKYSAQCWIPLVPPEILQKYGV